MLGWSVILYLTINSQNVKEYLLELTIHAGSHSIIPSFSSEIIYATNMSIHWVVQQTKCDSQITKSCCRQNLHFVASA